MTFTRRLVKLEIVVKDSVSVDYHPMRLANPHTYQMAPHAQTRVALS